MPYEEKDFKYLFLFKWMIPVTCWASVVLLFGGPFWFGLTWLWIVWGFSLLFMVVSIRQVMRLFIAVRGVRKAVNDYENRRQNSSSNAANDDQNVASPAVYHVLCVPNYKEPEELLAATLSALAEHESARREYIICLAMEHGEEGSDKKAEALISKFRGSFVNMYYTSHVKQPNEMRGKLSNVDWCFMHARENLELMNIPVDNVLLTTLDADAIIHELYFLEISRLWKEFGDGTRSTPSKVPREHLIFGAPGLFERNNYDVPFFTRVMDATWAILAMQQMASTANIAFPLSNYTLSVKLMEEVNFLDTHPDAIADDAHVFVKSFMKTGGNVRFYPVWAPINMLNLNEGSYFKTIWERFIQAKRHFKGQHDFSYLMYQVFIARSTPLYKLHLILLILKVIEANALPCVGPLWMMGAIPFIQLMDWVQPSNVDFGSHSFMTPDLVIAFGASLLVAYISLTAGYQYTSRLCNRVLFDKQSGSFLHLIEYVALIPDTFGYIIIPHMITSTLALFPFLPQGGYKVATKVMPTSEKVVDEPIQKISEAEEQLEEIQLDDEVQ